MLKKYIVISLCIFFIVSATATTVIARQEQRNCNKNRLVTFPSYLDITYDLTALQGFVQKNQPIRVPLTISYTTDTPATFGRLLPWQIKNIILYGSIIGPMQQIHIEVVDAPDWATIYFSQHDIYAPIPYANQIVLLEKDMFILFHQDAPSAPQSITIKVSCQQIGRIQGREIQLSIGFTPNFIILIAC